MATTPRTPPIAAVPKQAPVGLEAAAVTIKVVGLVAVGVGVGYVPLGAPPGAGVCSQKLPVAVKMYSR